MNRAERPQVTIGLSPSRFSGPFLFRCSLFGFPAWTVGLRPSGSCGSTGAPHRLDHTVRLARGVVKGQFMTIL
jgi:hypothetical protein